MTQTVEEELMTALALVLILVIGIVIGYLWNNISVPSVLYFMGGLASMSLLWMNVEQLHKERANARPKRR